MSDRGASVDPRPLVLVGLMGSGKTTVGPRLAAELGRPFVDNDVALRDETGRTPAEIVADDGADALHRHEAATLLAALARPGPLVIAAAASVVLDPTVRRRLDDDATVVWLQASDETLRARLADPGVRPNLGGEPARIVTRHHRERADWYRQVADYSVETTGRSPAAVVRDVTEWLRGEHGPEA